jgi:hypothetical protein
MCLPGEQLRKGAHLVEADTDLPPFFDTFDDYREFCLEYRASLGKIARLTACLLPEPALAAASRRLSSSLGLCSVSGASLEVCTFLLVATCYLLPTQASNFSHQALQQLMLLTRDHLLRLANL